MLEQMKRAGDADDPTEQHVSPATEPTHDSRTGDRTAPDDDDELGPDAVLVVVRHDDEDLSVMERELCDVIDGVASLERVADSMAISLRGARRLAGSLVQRGVVRIRRVR